ncbi:MAG: heavy-metal-associated domain-containing protein [Planctomycetia bacterium]|nr:heavy-metal-associated domain-containing protein [Planctomycetia bacterium]
MLVHRYKTDLHCGTCVEKVRPLLDAAPDVARWKADMTDPDKVLTVEGDGITAERVADLIRPAGYHVLGEAEQLAAPTPAPNEQPTSYYPLLLILLYLLGVVGLMELAAGSFDVMRAMGRFMAGFFLVFSFFKLLDVRAFADAYRTYDVVAARWPIYGYIYPFIEVALGVAYLTHFAPVATNIVTLVVMGVSTIGVVNALSARRKIRCACLGTVFNLPMSSVTLIEDALMVVMAAVMLVMMV